MMRDLVSAIAWLAVILPIVAGLYGIWSFAHPPVRQRTDRVRAIGCSAAVALVATAGMGLFLYLLGRAFLSTAPSFLEALSSAAPIGALFAMASIGGYAFLARRSTDPLALAGVLVGPALLILLPAVVATTIARALPS